MQCEQARLALWPRPGPQPEAGEGARALEHYAECAACQWFFRTQDRLGHRLARVEAPAAPATLTERIRTALAEEEQTRRAAARGRWLAGAGAALLTAAAVLVFAVRSPSVPTELVRPFVEHAQTDLGGGRAMTSSDFTELQSWLEGQVGYDLHLPHITGARLVGGRVAEIGGVRGAIVTYVSDAEGKALTYFALPSTNVIGGSLTPDQVAIVTTDDYEVAVWLEAGGTRAVVASMPRRRVVEIAEECKAQAGA